MLHEEVTLAVLAGGRGVRMGGAKSGLKIGEEGILAYLLRQMNWRGPTLLVSGVGNERPTGWELFDREATDAVADEGPLRGVLTAMQNAITERITVVTVDMPGMGSAEIDWLVEQSEDEQVVMMSRAIEGVEQVEPFPCVVRRSAAAKVEGRLARGARSMHGMCEEAGVRIVRAPEGWAERVWTNLNVPGDLERFVRGA